MKSGKTVSNGPRISGGAFRNRRLVSVADGIRPAMDQTRLALFSMLGPAVEGARVLDLFAGTGAYGFECMSRGADTVCWVDRSPEAVAQIEAQIQDWELPSTRFTAQWGDVLSLLDRLIEREEPNLIVSDPPYTAVREKDVHRMTLQKMHLNPKLPEKCLFIAEQSPDETPPREEGWELVRDRTYGKTKLLIYRREI